MKVFDAPLVATICTTRPSSTVPPQSLALLNSEFAIARAEAFAQRLNSKTNGATRELVRCAWQVAIGRNPSESEEALAVEFIETQRAQYAGDDAARWATADFCQMLFASNSFLYVE